MSLSPPASSQKRPQTGDLTRPAPAFLLQAFYHHRVSRTLQFAIDLPPNQRKAHLALRSQSRAPSGGSSVLVANLRVHSSTPRQECRVFAPPHSAHSWRTLRTSKSTLVDLASVARPQQHIQRNRTLLSLAARLLRKPPLSVDGLRVVPCWTSPCGIERSDRRSPCLSPPTPANFATRSSKVASWGTYETQSSSFAETSFVLLTTIMSPIVSPVQIGVQEWLNRDSLTHRPAPFGACLVFGRSAFFLLSYPFQSRVPDPTRATKNVTI